MTPLFNLFAPLFVWNLSVKSSVLLLLASTLLLITSLILGLMNLPFSNSLVFVVTFMFPLSGEASVLFFSLFNSMMFLNVTSLMVYSFPVTTTLGFNLSLALVCWGASMALQTTKVLTASFVLPQNSPWYLISFLCLVELVSVLVRPLTLCFRLLANMTAGHILITLVSKVSLWEVGLLLGGLELMVSVVQAFVFSMLISVYMDEVSSH